MLVVLLVEILEKLMLRAVAKQLLAEIPVAEVIENQC